MKPALAPSMGPRYEVACGNEVVATITGAVVTNAPGFKLTTQEKAALKRLLVRDFDGMTSFNGTGRQLSLIRKD